MTETADYWIKHLGMTAHPEGGYYVETYRAKTHVNGNEGEATRENARAISTGIYFLLRAGEMSHLHKVDADEMWHFYTGDPLDVFCLREGGRTPTLHLGPNATQGQWFQGVVPAGAWFGAKPVVGGAYGFSLVGCTVAPGFDFAGFELAKRAALTAQFPEHIEMITALTPDP